MKAHSRYIIYGALFNIWSCVAPVNGTDVALCGIGFTCFLIAFILYMWDVS